MNKQCFIYINIVSSTAWIGDAWGNGEATREREIGATVHNQRLLERMIQKVDSKLELAQRQ